MLATSLNTSSIQGSILFAREQAPGTTALRVRSRDTGSSRSDAESFLDPITVPGSVVQVDRDEAIVAQGERSNHCFQVVSGCVRMVRLMEDGRRQVAEFLFAGDVFGWETSGEYEFAAEAVTPVTLRRIGLSTIEERAARDPQFAQWLRRYAAGQMRQTRGRLMLLGRKTASERVASFLLEMVERSAPHADGSVDLPMSRADVADYLGLTTETVCRGLTCLRRQGTISVDRSKIVIRNRGALGVAGSDNLH